MEDIAFSDWPGQPVDLAGSNPWLPAYGFQPPTALLEREDFLGHPDADLFLHGSIGQQYMYLETIQEETSDDLRSESDRSESRASPMGWLGTNSESGSVIRVDAIDDMDCDSDRELACPAKRRRQDNQPSAISDDESCQSLSRSSSLLQFESLEKQCQDISSSSPSIFSSMSFDSLENHRKSDVSPDSLERTQSDGEQEYYKTLQIDIPRKKQSRSGDSLLYNHKARTHDSDSSESADSEDTLEASRYDSCKSVDNLKTWRSFDSLHVNGSSAHKTAKEKMSAENLSEDSGYSDHLCSYIKNKSSSIPNIHQACSATEKLANKEKSANKMDQKARPNNYAGFTAYDGDIFQKTEWSFGISFQDLSVVEDLIVTEYRSPLIDRFMRNGAVKRRILAANANRETFSFRQADTVNIEKTSECIRSAKYNSASTSEPNLLQAASDNLRSSSVKCSVNSLCDQQLNVKQCYLENSVCASSVPKDLNLAGDLKKTKDTWKFASDSPSIAEKNWDIADFADEVRDVVTDMSVRGKSSGVAPRKTPSVSSESDIDMTSFKREGSYMEAMTNMVDMSDDEHNPCYKEDLPKSTILEFDKRILKTISETSIKSFFDSNSQLDLMFSSTPVTVNRRNVVSTPNLTLLNRKDSGYGRNFKDTAAHSASNQDLPRKSSLVNRSTSTSGVSDVEEKTLTYTKSFSGSTNSKGVHFSPVVSEVNWQDDSNSPDPESSYSLSSTPEKELPVRAPSPPTPPLVRPKASVPSHPAPADPRVCLSQPDLQTFEESPGVRRRHESRDLGFVPLKPKQAVSQPNLSRRRSSITVYKEPDGTVTKAYTATDGVVYKHTHLSLNSSTVYQPAPTPSFSHVFDSNSAAEVKQGKAVRSMESSESRDTSKSPRSGKLGGFFSRIASFRFPTRKNDKKKKEATTGTKSKSSTENFNPQRVATKDDYIYIPLKGPSNEKSSNNNVVKPEAPRNKALDEGACVSAKPPLPKAPPRVVGASVKKRPETASAHPNNPERRTIDSGDVLPRPMEPMGLIETDLDTEVTVITSGAHVKTRSLMNLGGEAPPRSLAAPSHPSRPHKSMEFLLDKQNLKVVEPPENELQKGERVMSEHQLRVQRSLQKLNVPEWYKQSQVPREGFLLKKHSTRESRWAGTSNKTTSLSSLGSNIQSPVVLSPTPQTQPFVRWSTSKLNSTASSPCASTRSSFNARQPNGSISPSSIRSSFSYRQPYMGWRSQERLTRPRTPAERLASSLLSDRTQPEQQESPEIQTSIKEVTSAIVHYVSGLKPDAPSSNYDSQESSSHRSCSISPRGSQKLCWLESSFVGTRPLDSPQTPVTLSESQTSTPAPPSSLRLDLQAHNEEQPTTGFHFTLPSRSTTTKPSPGSTTLEDVLDSLLGLPSSTRAPSPSLQETASANTSPHHQSRRTEPFRRRSEGSDPSPCPPSARRNSLHASPILRCRYSRCGKVASATSTEGMAFKNCHNCSYTYCSRTCRRAHWEKHRKTCLFSRVGTLCRQILSAAKEQKDTLLHLSVIARRGYLAHGRGAVKCFFHCPEAAEMFLSKGLEAFGEPTYICWPDLLPSEMGPQMYTELVKMCKSYNPESKLILYVSVCVVSEAPAAGAVKWERQLVSRCAKMRLSKGVTIPEKETDNPETLILTCPPIRGDDVHRCRETSFNNIQKHLRQRGVSLRRHYPDIYNQLCAYVENSIEKFNPVIVYPRDGVTGKSFMCIIMPDAEPESVEQVTTAGVRICTVDVLQD